MNIEVITKEDLQVLRRELLEDLKQFLSSSKQEPKKWLRSADVRKMLNISPGTLQNLRINGQLKPSKIGGSFYYAFQDIQLLMLGDTKRTK
ncbi:helix-turn-helix domain-containing protein [Dyadobacter sandarakinus]|uniref:Helix-turn-helix domain-containing protein n=1 Tax=Dyadobacter sandarakinus TaxID=2747268 RepID=A0ABX7I7U8_9BACT|nr:helix-turn-helix domain-containing protein [Dyadobacter sandarakinus]QRR01557.1 helix-turn-helix domain-containing protein [Dyadobacter sandarakinus]